MRQERRKLRAEKVSAGRLGRGARFFLGITPVSCQVMKYEISFPFATLLRITLGNSS